jgi:hypothetical protein
VLVAGIVLALARERIDLPNSTSRKCSWQGYSLKPVLTSEKGIEKPEKLAEN